MEAQPCVSPGVVPVRQTSPENQQNLTWFNKQMTQKRPDGKFCKHATSAAADVVSHLLHGDDMILIFNVDFQVLKR